MLFALGVAAGLVVGVVVGWMLDPEEPDRYRGLALGLRLDRGETTPFIRLDLTPAGPYLSQHRPVTFRVPGGRTVEAVLVRHPDRSLSECDTPGLPEAFVEDGTYTVTAFDFIPKACG